MNKRQLLESILNTNIMVLDGAMGTMLHQMGLFEPTTAQAGGCEQLSLTHPNAIANIHRKYLAAGADIITTNTFCANAATMKSSKWVIKLNHSAATIARHEADRFSMASKPRFVAGSMGPTMPMLSHLAEFKRAQAAMQLMEDYKQQAIALIEGGVDLLLLETATDVNNVQIALDAIERAQQQSQSSVPVMVSATIGHKGTLPSGHSLATLLETIVPYKPLSVGLNCSLGAEHIAMHVVKLARFAPCYVSAHPNSGMPNMQGQYPQTPELITNSLAVPMNQGMLNIVGGCCGTTPEHIARIAQQAILCKPRRIG